MNVSPGNHMFQGSKQDSAVVGTINKLKRFHPQNILKMIYNALVLPHINYGLLLWGQNLGHIFKLQKWAMRAITCTKYNAPYRTNFFKTKTPQNRRHSQNCPVEIFPQVHEQFTSQVFR